MSKIRPLPTDLQAVAIKELNEVPERVSADIEALRTWIEQQPHLNARTDAQFLLAFLRGCKFSLERAKGKIDKYYAYRTKFPEFYTIKNVDDPRLLELVKLGVGLNLPTPLNGNGPRILFVRTGCYPVEKFSFTDVMAMSHGLQAITLMDDDYAMVNGIITILDMGEMTAGHMLQMTPTVAKKMSYFAEEAMPIREKGTHILNAPRGFEVLFNTLKPLMPAKQQERLYVHDKKLEQLYKYVPQKYLPKEYGGENGSIPELTEEGVRIFQEYRDFLIEENKYGSNEKLRQGKAIQFDTIFGVDGSFRQLNVD